MKNENQISGGDRTQKVREIVSAPKGTKSQWPSEHRWVIQAQSNVDGWQDSRYGAQIKGAAIERALLFLNEDKSWLGEQRLVRIVPCCELK